MLTGYSYISVQLYNGLFIDDMTATGRCVFAYIGVIESLEGFSRVFMFTTRFIEMKVKDLLIQNVLPSKKESFFLKTFSLLTYFCILFCFPCRY